jgi:hypothetical protein
MRELKKKKKRGRGEESALPSSPARSFKAPDRVIKAKSQGTKGLNSRKKPGRKTPSTTPEIASKGMPRSRTWLVLFANIIAFKCLIMLVESKMFKAVARKPLLAKLYSRISTQSR